MTDNRTNEQIVLKVLHPEATRNLPMAEGYAEKAVEALRAADRLAGEPTEAQVEAAAKAYPRWIVDRDGYEMPWEQESEALKNEYRAMMRATLVAAASVAPQASSASISQALGFLDHLNAQNHIDWISYSRLHDLISAIAPVQPSSTVESDCWHEANCGCIRASTVDEEKIAKVIASVTDLWDEPLDEVHDIPQIARAVVEAIGGERR